jgi:hypothetical protein
VQPVKVVAVTPEYEMISLSISTLPEEESVAVLATLIVVSVLFKAAANIVLPTVDKAPFKVVVADAPVVPAQVPAPQPAATV